MVERFDFQITPVEKQTNKNDFFFIFYSFRENSTRDETRQLKTGFTDCKDSKTSAIADCLLKGGNDADLSY